MAELGVIERGEGADVSRGLGFAFGAALCLHLLIGAIAQMNYYSVRPLPIAGIIDVQLVPRAPVVERPRDMAPAIAAPVSSKTDPPLDAGSEAETALTPTPTPDAAPLPTPQSPPASPVISAPPPILNSETGTPRGAFPAQDSGKDYVPSQWALEPPLSDKNLKGLGLLEDLDCLRALSEDCAALRKEVFAEFELTEMEKVWTPNRADTGLPSEFYGLSEREIRLKIGSKIAGENGFMILPGIGIDGSLWDMLHGVKKTCQMKRGINSDGRYEVVRVCPDSLPAARDKKYYIPPKN